MLIPKKKFKAAIILWNISEFSSPPSLFHFPFMNHKWTELSKVGDSGTLFSAKFVYVCAKFGYFNSKLPFLLDLTVFYCLIKKKLFFVFYYIVVRKFFRVATLFPQSKYILESLSEEQELLGTAEDGSVQLQMFLQISCRIRCLVLRTVQSHQS